MAKARTLVLNTKVNVTGADKLRGLGRTLQQTGGLLTAGLTLPLVGFGAAMLTAAQDAEKAQAKLTSVFDSMGAASFTTVKALNAQAEALQAATTFDDESITELQAVLLTFGRVTGDSFTRATAAALDMSALFEGGLQDAALQLGKALNDPIQGLGALRRVGVSFTEQQIEQIKVMQQSGDLLGAQNVILGALERQFGSVAETMAGTAGGQMTQALNQLGEASEEFGEVIAPVLIDVAKGLKEFAKWLRQLNPETKEWVLRIGLLAAALGPVLIVVGTLVRTFAGLRTAGLLLARTAPLIGASFHLMLGPLGLVTAAVATLAAAFATDFLGVRTRFEKDMGDIGAFLGDASQAFRDFFGVVEKEAPRLERVFASSSSAAHAWSEDQAAAYAAATAAASAGVTDMAAEFGGLDQKMADALLEDQFQPLKDAIDELNAFTAAAVSPAVEIFRAQAFLNSKEYAEALTSNNPLIRDKAEEMGAAAQEVLDRLDGGPAGASLIRSWTAGMTGEFWRTGGSVYKIKGLAGTAASIFGRSLPTAGPLKGGVAAGGESIVQSWFAGMSDAARHGMSGLQNAVSGVSSALVPGFATLRPASVPAGMGGGTTNIYNNFTFSGTPSGSPNELSSLLRDLSAVSGGDVRYG